VIEFGCFYSKLTPRQKSKDKNTSLEEQHRRNEISMRRKQQQAGPLSPSALSDSDGPKSPASTGAMDDLLQKLRAAKPEARDQRDRRRRARLKDRHQVRVASGQQIPEIGVNVEGEGGEEGAGEGEDKGAGATGMLSPTSEAGQSETSMASSILSPTSTGASQSAGGAGADVADRAAAMLEGLQSANPTLNKDGSLSVRRRRESADSERERRRRRRQQSSKASGDDGGLMSPSIPEERDDVSDAGSERPVTRDGRDDGDSVMGDVDEATTPVTVVHPPSPERGAGKELPAPPDEE
jgi:cytokinesis protein